MNDLLSDFQLAKQRLHEWYQSEKYQRLCQRFTAECERLTLLAQKLYPLVDGLKAFCQEQTQQQELATGCRYMHRGFYCPSLVQDWVISNVRRGKLLKRPNSRSKPSYEYGFDASGRLLWSHNKNTTATEYLLYVDDAVYGMIVDKQGHLCTFVEETYKNGRLTSYSIAVSNGAESEFSCDRLFAEYYTHDELGLSAAQMYDFIPPLDEIPDFLKELGADDSLLQPQVQCIADWQFEREGGYIIGYRAYPTSYDRPVSPVQPIDKPRKA